MQKIYSIQLSFEFATYEEKNRTPFSYLSFNSSLLEQKLDPKGVNIVGEHCVLNNVRKPLAFFCKKKKNMEI